MVKSRPPSWTPPPPPDQRAVRWVSFPEARERLQGLTAVVLDADVESSGRIFVSLGQVGMQVRLARRFVPGLQLLDEVKPDFLLAATRLSDGDVLELFRRLTRESPRPPRLVALSGRAGRLPERRFLAAGCEIFIRKPIDVRLFAQELARQLPAPRAEGAEARAGKEATEKNTIPGSRRG
jgi:CheY-like chemotaxis protein